MSFEIIARDLTARIGRFESKSGVVETPQLLPVINPNVPTLLPKALEEKFGCRALITNAYIIRKKHSEDASQKGLHNFLDFHGTIMTDSGAYQLLIYKGVETTPEEIVRFQEMIDTDIATILDVPTGWAVTKKYAKQTVDETIKRAKEQAKMKTREDIAWVGPVQGGKYLDLVARSAREMGKLPFQIHALGSPTPVMEQYKFDTLVDMIMIAKMNLPACRPLHLFGAGHPFMFALVVALGCDFFDSAAYALFAREDRYMTESGTARLKELKYFPCSCPVCSKTDPENVKELPNSERQKLLAEHNLHVSFGELRRIKEAIDEGRLWEHLEMRAHGHPSLLQALKKVGKYSEHLEEQSPVTKKSGIFYFTSVGLARPEIVRHRKRICNRYSPPPKAKILLLLPQTQTKPFQNSKEHRKILKKIRLADTADKIHVCVYAAPFGVVPLELSEVYPLSQHEIAIPLDAETVASVAKQVANYIEQTNYERIILLLDTKVWRGKITAACRRAGKKKNVLPTILREKEPWTKKTLDHLAILIRESTLQS
jgi:7-cyano-7-deazaguanine tRNA-ribosyltransferase